MLESGDRVRARYDIVLARPRGAKIEKHTEGVVGKVYPNGLALIDWGDGLSSWHMDGMSVKKIETERG